MSLVEQQWAFLKDIARLINFAQVYNDIMLTAGEFYESPDEINPEHLKSGQHPKRLAADLNLFVNGNYISGSHLYWNILGDFWKSLGSKNRWGGDFSSRDFNHFERRG